MKILYNLKFNVFGSIYIIAENIQEAIEKLNIKIKDAEVTSIEIIAKETDDNTRFRKLII